jgi:hypothetical protein
VYRAYILSKSARSPRFRTERENWVQRVVADGHAICILPERSAAAPGFVTRPIEGLFGAGIGDRDGLGIDHSGRDTEDRATRLDVRMAVRTVAAVPPPLWKLYSQRIGKLRPALRCLKTMHVPWALAKKNAIRGTFHLTPRIPVKGGVGASSRALAQQNNAKREEPYASQDAGDDN